jgi:hypothetical protein
VSDLSQVFAAISDYGRLRRIAGGYQTDVYGSDDHHYVVKLKNERGTSLRKALRRAQTQRMVADEFVAALGTQHTIASNSFIAGTSRADAHVLVIQPFIVHARTLRNVRYDDLHADERAAIAMQLQNIMCRSLALFWRRGYMPDLNGLPPSSNADRRRLATWFLVPLHVWRFFTKQTLLRSNNLLLHFDPPVCIVLVDYDLVHAHWLARRVYYSVRALLFLRDWWLVRRMQHED